MKFDLIKAESVIDAGCAEIPEYIALGFAIGILHLMTTGKGPVVVNSYAEGHGWLRSTDDFRESRQPRIKGRMEKKKPIVVADENDELNTSIFISPVQLPPKPSKRNQQRTKPKSEESFNPFEPFPNPQVKQNNNKTMNDQAYASTYNAMYSVPKQNHRPSQHRLKQESSKSHRTKSIDDHHFEHIDSGDVYAVPDKIRNKVSGVKVVRGDELRNTYVPPRDEHGKIYGGLEMCEPSPTPVRHKTSEHKPTPSSQRRQNKKKAKHPPSHQITQMQTTNTHGYDETTVNPRSQKQQEKRTPQKIEYRTGRSTVNQVQPTYHSTKLRHNPKYDYVERDDRMYRPSYQHNPTHRYRKPEVESRYIERDTSYKANQTYEDLVMATQQQDRRLHYDQRLQPSRSMTNLIQPQTTRNYKKDPPRSRRDHKRTLNEQALWSQSTPVLESFV